MLSFQFYNLIHILGTVSKMPMEKISNYISINLMETETRNEWTGNDVKQFSLRSFPYFFERFVFH